MSIETSSLKLNHMLLMLHAQTNCQNKILKLAISIWVATFRDAKNIAPNFQKKNTNNIIQTENVSIL